MAQKININPDEVSSLTLAYIGDSVYELEVRTYALKCHNGNVNDVNQTAKEFSKAVTQSLMIELIEEDLTEEEHRIYKRGRNAKSVSAPHTCSISEYRRATGFEALCGHLYLEGKTDRVKEIVSLAIEKYLNRERS